jgi:hypothetical protein
MVQAGQYSYRELERASGVRHDLSGMFEGAYAITPDRAALGRLLRIRAAVGAQWLLPFERWMITVKGYKASTAARKRKLVLGARCDYTCLWDKALHGADGTGCRGARSASYVRDIRIALRDYAAWKLETAESSDEEREEARETLRRLGFDVEEVDVEIALRHARSGERGKTARRTPKASASPAPTPPPAPEPAPAPAPPPPTVKKRVPKPAPTLESIAGKQRLDYAEAAVFCGLSIGRLRNLVCMEDIPVYGSLRSRWFEPKMLQWWMTNRDAAMRAFRAGREAHHGE